MKLYIANCTRQVLDFMYRLPEHPTPLRQRIEIGHQIAVPGELSTKEIEFVTNAHRIYGMVDVKDVDHTKAFIGTCYSVDKPVKVGSIQFAMQHNNEVLVERGKEMRKEAAVVINNALDEATGGQSLSEADVSVVEERGLGGDAPSMSEGVVVRKDVTQQAHGTRRGGGGQRNRK